MLRIFFKSTKLIIALLVLIVLIIAAYRYWQHNQQFPSTDDAYVQSHIVNIAPAISGRVVSVHVSNHQSVRPGQLLFVIDPLQYKLALSKAEANLRNLQQTIASQKQAIASAQAAVNEHQQLLQTQQRQTTRTLSLVQQKLVAAEAGDQALDQLNTVRSALASAKSTLANAKAAMGDSDAQIKAANDDINTAKLNLNHTYVSAPAAGIVNNLELRPGDTVNAYQSVFALVERHHFWLSANFKETQLLRIRKGQAANISIDMYPGHQFQGVVDSISTGSGSSFSLIPAENASGNWVKVTQRFPVKVLIQNDPNFPLRIGASAVVTINTRAQHPTAHKY